MRLYRNAKGRWVATKADAGKGGRPVEVPTTKPELLAFLNDNAAPSDSPAYIKGRADAEQGITTNPYSSHDLRADWERGHADTYEAGLSKLQSFAAITKGRKVR